MLRTLFNTIKRFDMQYARFLSAYIILAIIASVCGILVIRATGSMTEAAWVSMTGEMVGFLTTILIFGTVQVLAESLCLLLQTRLLGKAMHAMRKTFAKRLLYMPYKSVAMKNSGDGISLFSNDIPQAAELISRQAYSQVSQITTLLISAGFMLYINWWLTLAYFVTFPLLALLQAKIAVPIGKKSMEASKRRSEFNTVVADALQNPLTVKAYGLEAAVERRYDESFMRYFSASYSSTKTKATLALMGIFASFAPTFGLFLASCAVVIRGHMTIGQFIAMTIIAGPVGSWLAMFAQDIAAMQQASASATRVMDFIQDGDAKQGNAVERTFADGNIPAIRFDNVSFGYGDGSEVFDGLSFYVEKGTITAIAGASGCGKSTVLSLILGLYAPSGGNIALSSEKTSYVPQNCYLLPVSIGDNITCGLPVDESKLRDACENAGIYSFIMGLPQKFDSVLSESADNISGGQKQRIAMARAFYQDADILLFDEATSALDPLTESAVLDAFKKYVKISGKTAVMVAHRESVLKMADSIISLGVGNVYG